ncbi:MAG: AAA domain-containing protein [Nitriliruptorales bacterium]|nr:AAA domain-containing protein [Nitriliruptorales bacterium]
MTARDPGDVVSDSPRAPTSVEQLQQQLADRAYLADRGLATAVYLALRLGRPLLLEGDAGVGKTEAAKVLASALDAPLIRLQCYEGIDVSQALYEWDYPRQLLHLRAVEAAGSDPQAAEADLYSRRFLLERPLLRAIQAPVPPVLLIDEIDRADDEFEAFLLEVLADFQVTIPELGTITADRPPIVVLTSNRTRELHEALRRRCLYHWIDHPTVEREAQIIALRAPQVAGPLADRIAQIIARIRTLDLFKPPGVAESIDWARVLSVLGVDDVTPEIAADTLGTVVKERDDMLRVRAALNDVL